MTGLLVYGNFALPRTWAIAAIVAVAAIGVQGLAGPITYGGDAWMAGLYVLTFVGAIAVGQATAREHETSDPRLLDLLPVGTALVAIASVAIALMQWMDVEPLPLPVAALLRGDRPYANFAQANNFCTAVFLGLCSLCWLRESRRIGTVGWVLGSAFLLFGMTMSGSRTGWLQVAAAAALIAWRGPRAPGAALRLPHALVLLAGLAAMTLAWPALNDALLLSGSRSTVEQAQAGLRLPIWQLAIDAISRQPLWGYGWQQIPAAQWAVALDHAPLQRYFEHAHNLVLDLMLWAGIPVGGFIVACAGYALWRQARAIHDARALWLFAGVLGFIAHALLEQPHAYAYLLLPVGVALGVVHGLCPGQAEWHLRPAVARTAWAAMGVALALTAADYLEIEQNYRLARMESTFGERRIVTPPPEPRVLSQLGAFMRFIRTEARPDMMPAELDAMRAVAHRYAHPPVLLRLALAEGLNGHPEAARDTLRRLCAMHLTIRCNEGRDSWLALQQQYPVLRAVPAPEVPAAR
jgi:O-antigen ligase